VSRRSNSKAKFCRATHISTYHSATGHEDADDEPHGGAYNERDDRDHPPAGPAAM
jgi:hypothetical protein